MGQEEQAVAVPAVVFSWEHELGLGVPESPKKLAPVVLSWEHEPAVKKTVSSTEGPRKAPPLARRLSVPPPPGRPAGRGFSRAVRPEDDPFLAAYLACTKSGGDGGKKREPKGQGQRRFALGGLGLGRGLGVLSCKRSNGVVEQSMVRLAKLPEVHPRDA